ncbi:MAG TPA: FAD-dependent thymidylate synthase [Acidimicrobiales bacterium]|jgi:thymidylate synthase ThyX|nr:FAD-dependent thymidylate synthase [Acidimicrobiales bacterium]
MTVYIAEEFTTDEADVLRRYFTNLDGPVFALVNLPEVVKGALFARYSRSPKSLRRLFLDEFVGDLDISGDDSVDATVGLDRAEELYDRVFFEYGDDSVAQLGGVHLACEQASNVLTKVLEWGRLMSYLEQSTRYINYDSRLDGRYRFYRDPDVLNSTLGLRYVGDLDRLFDTYAEMTGAMVDFFREAFPKQPGDSDFVHRQAVRAKALDAVRGVLPAATLSNVGIYGTGQAYEALLVRMRSQPLPEARQYADLMLTELRKVIPSFLKRVDLPDRGVATSDYLARTRDDVAEIAARLFPDDVDHSSERHDPGVELLDWDPDGEIKAVAAMLYPHSDQPESRIDDRVRDMTVDERLAVIRAYVGERSNRRHRPGRAFERTDYRFDVLADYGAFRDLQRHRMLTVDWQPLTPRHGYTRPDAIELAGLADEFDQAMERSAELHDALAEQFPRQAPYAVALAYRIRFSMQMNAREAMHLIELRSTPQGHPAYRTVAQEMHRLIAEKAGHRALAEAMRFVDHSAEPTLERLDAERRAEQRRASR